MIAALDSAACRPTAAQADAARVAGIRVWSGYLTTRPNVGIYGGSWSREDFENARRCGGRPIAFCSGWDDPVALRALAAAWRVRLCLDVEFGIRDDGPWVPDWLRLSGAGLYGNFSVHYHTGEPIGRGATFNIGAAYPGFDPRMTWPSYLPRPDAPCGWQREGSHQEFGCEVDSSWLDDWFGQSEEEVYMAGGSVTIKGQTFVAGVTTDGRIALAGSTGGMGGLWTGDWLPVPGTPPDVWEAWLGEDEWPAGSRRLLIFCVDVTGKLYGAAVDIEPTLNFGMFRPVAGMGNLRLAGPTGAKGEPGPPGPAGPPGSGADDAHIRAVITEAIANG